MFRNKKISLFVLATLVCLQSHESLANALQTAGKIESVAKVTSTMWKAIKGDVENDGSSDARIGLLIANQFL